MKKANKKEFIVSLNLPVGAGVGETKEYILDAIISHCGGSDPESNFFFLDRNSVKVTQKRIAREGKYGIALKQGKETK